jgi:hypothetical protein
VPESRRISRRGCPAGLGHTGRLGLALALAFRSKPRQAPALLAVPDRRHVALLRNIIALQIACAHLPCVRARCVRAVSQERTEMAVSVAFTHENCP